MSCALDVLEGQALESVRVQRKTGATDFEFDLGTALLIRPYESGTERKRPEELWTLRSPDGQYLAVRDDGTYSRNDADASPDDYLWLVLPT